MIYFGAQTDSTTHTNRIVGDNTYCIEEGMMWERDTRGGKTEDVWMTYSSSSHPWYRSASTQEDEVTPLTHKLSHTHTTRGFLRYPSYLQPPQIWKSKRPIPDLKTSSTTAFPSKIYGLIFTTAANSQILLHVLSSVCHNFYQFYHYSSTTPFSNTLLKCNTKHSICP